MEFPRRDDSEGLPGSWMSDPEAVDGYQLGGLPWPVETTRHAYLTLLGGFSEEIDPTAIGLHRQALEENTDLEAGDRVTVSTFRGGEPVPFLARPSFQVVPLDFERPDAFLQSREGEAVLPSRAVQADLPGLEELERDIEVVINGVLAARLRGGPGS
jgi:hypothetical protein